jgi:hypothetical protein
VVGVGVGFWVVAFFFGLVGVGGLGGGGGDAGGGLVGFVLFMALLPFCPFWLLADDPFLLVVHGV